MFGFAHECSDKINFDGIEALCKDLAIDANDVSIFIFAWHCNASTLGEFSWEEFRRGAEELRIDSIASFKGLQSCNGVFFVIDWFLGVCRAGGSDEGGAN